MADTSNPTIDKIKQRLAQGYSLEELMDAAKAKGLYEGDVETYFTSLNDPQLDEKKKSSLDSSTVETSMELSLDGGVSDLQDSEPSSTVPTGDTEVNYQDSQKERGLMGIQSAINKMEGDAKIGEANRLKIQKGTEPKAPVDFAGNAEVFDDSNPMHITGGIITTEGHRIHNATAAYERDLALYHATSEENQELSMGASVREINLAYAKYKATLEGGDLADATDERLDGHGEGNLISYDADGKLGADFTKLSEVIIAGEAMTERKLADQAFENSNVAELGKVGKTLYALNTGAKSLANSFLAIADSESAAANVYNNQGRSTASKTAWGVSLEDQQEGVIENVLQGDFAAAGKNLAISTAEQLPQLLAQASIAYVTGGFGLVAKGGTAAMRLSTVSKTAQAAFMGGSSMGGTMAAYKGVVSDDKLMAMAVGDALVEFVSEYALSSDIEAMLGGTKLGRPSMKTIRRTMFKKGVFSKEFAKVAGTVGVDLAKTGGEEFIEELAAGVGSQVVHAVINDEEFNIFEIMDGGLIGLSSGIAAGSRRALTTTLNAGYSAVGFGGFRSEMIKIKNAKQVLSTELQNTTDETEIAAIEAKIENLSRLEGVTKEEQHQVYEEYSDDDAKATIKLNQNISGKIVDLRKLNEQIGPAESNADAQKAALAADIQAAYSEIQVIEAKYQPNVEAIRAQTQAVNDFHAEMDATVEVNEDTKLSDNPLFNGIKNLQKALAVKGTKVFMHKDLDAAAEATGQSKMDIAGANGIFIAADNSVHIMPSIAKNNTAYHEGFHKILREVDKGYAKRFVDAAFNGMDADVAAKYEQIYDAANEKGGVDLAVEEVFAELNADIAVGDISVEGSGTSVARAAMGTLGKAIQKLGIPVKPNATFKEFTDFVQAVSDDFTAGNSVRSAKADFGTNEAPQENSAFYQAKKVEKLSKKEELQQPTINIAKGQTFNESFINDATPTTNLASVVENFTAENGRAPSILFWMGDQTGRGTYTTADGTAIPLEGGVSYAVDQANSDKGVVWASNKNGAGVNGMVKGADIVAIVSGSPDTGHKFYKGATTVFLTEYMEAANRSAGKTVMFSKGSAKTAEVSIEIPAEGYTDPLQALNDFNSQIQGSRKARNNKTFMDYWSNASKHGEKKSVVEYGTLEAYLADVEGDRMGGIDMFTQPTKEMDAFVAAMGMKPLADMNTELRDGYLVENDFKMGDIYAYMKLERDAEGVIVTSEGDHGTYGTDIHGELIGVANRKDNIYSLAAVDQSTTKEFVLSGKGKVEMLLGSDLKTLDGKAIVTQKGFDAIEALPEKDRKKEYGRIIASAAAAAKASGDQVTLDRLGSGKGGYVQAAKAGDKSSKRVVSDAGTLQDGAMILDSMIFGQTVASRVEALQKAADELVAEGHSVQREFIISGKGKDRKIEGRSVLPVGKVVERANKLQDTAPRESLVPESSRKAGIFFQSAIINEVSAMISNKMKKADILANLQAKGLSRADAMLVYAKASQYSRGHSQGFKKGTRERSAHFAAAIKKARTEESEKATVARKALQEMLKNKDVTIELAVEAIVKIVEAAGISLKANQISQLVKLTASATMKQGAGTLTEQGRFDVLNAVSEKVIAIVNKEQTAQDVAKQTAIIRTVSRAQDVLRKKLQKLKDGTKSPIISYSEQILNLTSINAALLSYEQAVMLKDALKEITNSTKTVSAKGGQVAGSYVFVEGMEGAIDTRRAKIYFDEIYEGLHAQELINKDITLINQALDNAFTKGSDWVAEYDLIMRTQTSKHISAAQAKLEDIAKELGFDLTNINDLDQALDQLAQDNKNAINANRLAVIEQAILPTFLNHRRIFDNHPAFAAIFNVGQFDNDALASDIVRARMDKLTGLEAKRLEFAMYDYVVNGQAYGVQAIEAVVIAKNEASDAMKAINIKAEKFKSGGATSFFEMFETTPLFFRRIFKVSPVKIAQFQAAIGFAELVQEASMADRSANEFVKDMAMRAKSLGQESLAAQVKLQAYSVLTQRAKDVDANAHLLQTIASFEMAQVKDMRFSDAQRAEVAAAIQQIFYNENGSKKDIKLVIEEMESDADAMQMVDEMRFDFETMQLERTRNYAEEFLGMAFVEEANYLPMSFRSIGSRDNDIESQTDKINNIQKSFNAHGLTTAQAQSKSTFARNDQSIGTKQRYIDINIYASVASTFRENEIKIRTASSVARISAVTAESNQAFADVVESIELRQQIRQKAVQTLLGNTSVTKSDEDTLGPWLTRNITNLNNITVLWFFGTIYTQMWKQAAAVLNTITEGGDPTALMRHALTAATNGWSDGQKALIEQSDIGQRDYVKETINSSVKGNALESEKSIARLRKGAFELSTAALRRTDRFAATASWFAYYEQFMIREEGHVGEVNDAVWDTWGKDMNRAAAAYSSLMVAKDQNISSKRDASNFNNLNKGKFGSVVQMIIIPFANFMINKKMNMAIDFRGLGDSSTRGQSMKSLGGSALEIAAFHGVSNFVLMPMISALTDGLLGKDEEEDSWFDKEFRLKMFAKGMVNDMNPLVLPVGGAEFMATKLANFMMFLNTESDESNKFDDRDYWENFAAWERMNGLPIFDQAGRSDVTAINMAKNAGVYGDVLVQYGTAVYNLKSLNDKNPSVMTKSGAIKFVNPEDVKQLLALNASKVGLMTGGAFTGLFAKELVQIVDRRSKQIIKGATTNENLSIAKMIVKENPLGRELFDDKLNEVKSSPLRLEGKVNAIVGDRTIVSAKAENEVDPKYINTIRTLSVMSQDSRDVAVYLKQVMSTMKPIEAKELFDNFIKYYILKKGENAIIDIESIVNNKDYE